MQISASRHRSVIAITTSVVTMVAVVLLVAMLMSPRQASAQQTCPSGQTYCPSGEFVGQCRPNTGTCVDGSYTTCSGCVCPTGFERFSGNTCCASGTLLCGSTCQTPKQCPDANRATSNECAASNAASCGSCASGYELNNGTGLCEQAINVVVAPQTGQLGNSDRPAVNLVQRGAGLLLNLQSQTGDSTSTRKTVLSVDKTGLQIGFHSEPSKKGIDLSAAGGQNLIFGIARAVGMDAALDALLLLQTIEQDGSIVDRIRMTRDGNLTAAGDVRGQRLCIGGSCRDSWSAVTSSSVLLQNATPGTAQTGHLNVSGTARVGVLELPGGGTLNLQGATVTNATWIGGGVAASSPPFLRFANGDLVYAPTNTGDGKGLIIANGATNPAVVGYAKIWHDGNDTAIGDTTSDPSSAVRISGPNLIVSGGITAGGNVGVIGTNGKIPALSSAYLSDLSGANLTGLNASNLASGTVPAARLPSTVILEGESGATLTALNASNLASGTVPDARLPLGLLQNPIDGGASNVGPWLTIQGGATALGNIALRLYDAGTADGNGNILEFAHNGGSGPVLGSKLRSMNVGANAASGSKLILETTSNNTGTLNANQLVLDRDGNVGVGVADPSVRLEVGGALTTTGNIIAGGSLTSGNLTVNGTITSSGDVTVNGDLTADNGYECVNVGSELRCTLRQQWRVADKQSGYVMSWVGSDSCSNVCTRAGVKACTDIQFNYECPNGNLLNAGWSDDDPGEFGGAGRTCSSVEPYRATVSGITCPGQSGTEYKRYRCRCQS